MVENGQFIHRNPLDTRPYEYAKRVSFAKEYKYTTLSLWAFSQYLFLSILIRWMMMMMIIIIK